MDWGKSRLVLLIVVGWCLALVCSGCCPRLRHGCIVRGNWSLECNRVPWLTSRSACQEESCQPCGADQPVCTPEPGRGPAAPIEGDGQPIGPQQSSYEVPCSPDGCAGCGPGRKCRLGGRCGKREGPAEVNVGYHNHPRFHPVPTRPVFCPRFGPALDVPSRLEATDDCSPLPPGDGPAPIDLTPPVPVPEEIRAPEPESNPTSDRVTQAPRNPTGGAQGTPHRLAAAAPRSPSWIFTPPTARTPDSAKAESEPQARWIRR